MSMEMKTINLTFTVYDDDEYLHVRFMLPSLAAMADWQKQYPNQGSIVESYLENVIDVFGVIYVLDTHPYFAPIKLAAAQAVRVITESLNPSAVETLGWRQVENRHYVFPLTKLLQDSE